MTNNNQKQDKTKGLLLYVAKKLQDRPNYGTVLLNKVLYYIDNTAYIKNGEPISSFVYVKQKFGPTPNPRQFNSLKEELLKSDSVFINFEERFGRNYKKLVVKNAEHQDLSNFTPNDIAIIDEVIEQFGHLSGSEISEFSHEEIAWKVARDFEELPFFTYLLTEAEVQDGDIFWAKEEISKRESMLNN